MGKYSDFLFVRPTALEGIGSLLDFGEVRDRYNISETPEVADRTASRMDWKAVAEDFKKVMSQSNLEERLKSEDR